MAKKNLEKILEKSVADWKKRSAIIARIFVLAMVILFPLFMYPSVHEGVDANGVALTITNFYENMTNNKQYVFTFICLGALVALAVVYLRSMMDGNHPRGGPIAWLKRMYPHEIALIAFVLVLIVSALQANYIDIAWLGLPRRNGGALIYMGYIATFLVISRLYKPKKVDALIACIVCAISAIIGIFQYFGVDFLGLYPSTYQFPPLDATLSMFGPDFYANFYANFPGYIAPGPSIIHYATIGNTNFLSTYLCMIFCLGSISFIQGKKKWTWAFLPCVLIILFMIRISSTDSVIVGVLAAFGIGLGMIIRNLKTLGKFLVGLSGLVLVEWFAEPVRTTFDLQAGYSALHGFFPFIAAALLIAGCLLIIRPMEKDFPKIVRLAWIAVLVLVVIAGMVALPMVAESTGDKTLTDAAALLKGDFPDEAGNGRGFIWKRSMTLIPERPLLGYGPDNFGPVFATRFGEDMANSMFATTPVDKAHNEYIQLLVDTGIIGCAVFVAFFALLFWRFRKFLDNTLAVAFGLTAFAYISQAFFNITLPVNGPVAWALLGVFGATMNAKIEKTHVKGKEIEAASQISKE